jgi:DNA-binding IclR family transcriptional regulator
VRDQEEDRPVAALERGLRLLGAFSTELTELSLTELSERIGVHKSTVMRLANTLESAGYLERAPSGKYCLGASLLRLALFYRAAVRPPEVILSVMRKLVVSTRESATYSVRRGDLRVCVYRVDSPSRIRDHLSVGDVFPIGKGASGRVFEIFDSPLNAVRTARAGGLVLSSTDELAEGMAGIAAPVFDESGALAGALAVSGPKSRLGDAQLISMHADLLQAAHDITFKLGGDVTPFAQANSAG